MSGTPGDLVRELLVESLAAWRVAGDVAHSPDGSIVLLTDQRSIRVEREAPGSMFRWMVTIDDRKRPAISLVAVLRQLREAIDPGYPAKRVRVTVAPLVPP